MHKNKNEAESNFIIYLITIFQEIFKFGKADAKRITRASSKPTRLHQQMRKLQEQYGRSNVEDQVIENLDDVTSKEAKEREKAILQQFYDQTGKIPKGNEKSFKPKNKK